MSNLFGNIYTFQKHTNALMHPSIGYFISDVYRKKILNYFKKAKEKCSLKIICTVLYMLIYKL